MLTLFDLQLSSVVQNVPVIVGMSPKHEANETLADHSSSCQLWFWKRYVGMTPEEITGSLRVSHSNNLSFNQD
jgi:hypothetical protein